MTRRRGDAGDHSLISPAGDKPWPFQLQRRPGKRGHLSPPSFQRHERGESKEIIILDRKLPRPQEATKPAARRKESREHG